MAVVILAIGLVLLAAWLALRHCNDYWKRHGVPCVPATLLLGNMKEICMFRKAMANHFQDMYNNAACTESPVVGINIFLRPALMVRDLDLVKTILVKDFASFSNRQGASDIHNDMIGGGNLFLLKNPSWKSLRARLTPTFTIGRMKNMFGLMRDIGANLDEFLLSEQMDERTKMFQLEFRDIFARYSVDNISSCAFGIQTNSIRNPDNAFFAQSRKIFKFTIYRAIEFTSIFFLPEFVPWFGFKAFGREANNFFRDSINFVMDERAKTGAVRNDMIDTLLKLREEDKDKPYSSTEIVFQGDALVAQAAVFFAGGFETTSTLLAFGLFELCRRPEMQIKIRAEIKDILNANNGELTYESVFGMEFLGMVMSEVLRLYPALPFLDRQCTLPPDSDGFDLRPFSIDYKIPHGMSIFIPIHAIHRDPKYWPHPERFDPERFSAKNKANIVPYSYLPFGEGPHNCIGNRFGNLQARLGFVNFFRNHRVAPSERTPERAKFDRLSMIIQMDGGVHLNVIRDPL